MARKALLPHLICSQIKEGKCDVTLGPMAAIDRPCNGILDQPAGRGDSESAGGGGGGINDVQRAQCQQVNKCVGRGRKKKRPREQEEEQDRMDTREEEAGKGKQSAEEGD